MNTAPLTLLRDFSDRLSPMVVKELRHGLRTRAFTSLLTTFQICMILLVGTGMLGVPMQVITNIFWGLSLLILLVALPLRGFATLSGEVQGGTMDMLTLTSISSFRIVYGKWSALFSQTLLLACSLLPYMVARYYFGGVEIVAEAFALVLAVLGSALSSAGYVAFSSQRSMVLKLFLTVGTLTAMIPGTAFIFMMINAREDVLSPLFNLPWLEQAALLGGIVLVAAYGVFTFLAMGASRIAPVSENHSTWKRLIHLGMLTLLAAAVAALAFHPFEGAMFWAYVPSLALTLLVGVDVLTEEMPRFPSVVQGMAQKGRFSTGMGRLFYPGWASGVFFYTLLATMNVGVILIGLMKQGKNSEEEMIAFIACVMLAVLVPVSLKLNKKNRFANWWVVQIALGVAGVLLAIFMGISGSRDLGFLGVVTPITGLFGAMNNYQHNESILATSAFFGLCWLGAAIVQAVREDKIYSKLEAEARELSASSRTSEP